MRILIDICHPAHVHFFRHTAVLLRQRGHEVLITSRDKEIALELLERLGLAHRPLSREGRGGLLALGGELVRRNLALLQVVREYRPDVMAAIGGIFIAQVGRLAGVPSVVFYDTENARLQNLLTYPFASCVVAPRCYEAWLPRQHIRYAGYHELAYLHPDQFVPDRGRALANGVAPDGDTFFLRLVAWRANHDLGERGWTTDLLRRTLARLEARGRVLISAEGPLPPDLEPYRYRGAPDEVHHVLAFCRLFVGESATMASECAVLGVPAIYAARTGRGYTNEQERRYGLVRNVHTLAWEEIDSAIGALLATPPDLWQECRRRLLDETIAVAPFAASCIEDYRAELQRYRH